MYVIRVIDTAGPTVHPFYIEAVGKFLQSWDVNAAPMGVFVWTDDLEKAFKFHTQHEAMLAWKEQSKRHPRREWDNHPNRPMCAWTIEILTEEAAVV